MTAGPLTATEVRYRIAEWEREWYAIQAWTVQPMIDRIWRLIFSRRGQALYFGVKTPPRTDDMAQMVDDLARFT